jgi:hypothetical protein
VRRLEPRLQLGDRESIDSRRAFVRHHALIRHTACCCVPQRLPSAVTLPVSFAQQPPKGPRHPRPIPAGSACLRRCGPHSHALLPYRLASRSAVLPPCFRFGPSPSCNRCRASIRFLFVRPAFCLQVPPDSISRWTPLPFG